jgi:hypothetical protein
MTIRIAQMSRGVLLQGVAVAAMTLAFLGAPARAADQKTCAQKCVRGLRHKRVAAHSENPLAAEVQALQAEVAALKQRLDASDAAARQAQAAAAQAQASARSAQAAAETDQTAISQIPTEVTRAVAALPKPANDGWWFKGVKFTPGGYLALESRYASRGLMSDGATSPPFASFPYAGSSSKASHMAEWRASARQSRVSGLAEADVAPDIKLTGYGEFDFLAAAQTANNNESNSFNLRIRHLYSTLDLKRYGLSFLAGQNWSLAVLNDKGITPRNEVIPLTIDAQYNVGFVWARQPQLRVTEDFGHGLWAAVSAENSETNNVGGTPALLPGVGAVTFNQQCGALFNSANNCSFNHVPDVIGKLAWDNPVAGRRLHVEGFGLYRDFYDRVGTGCSSAGATAACAAFHNADSTGWGGGFGVVGQIAPGLLDAQVSGLFGRGVSRYGASQFPDVYELANGELAGVHMHMLLAGLTLHPTPLLDIYVYAGEERAQASPYAVGSAQGGYGNPQFSNLGGCELATQLACSGDTRLTREATIGFWDKAFTGDMGSFRLGLQYSYVRRESFSGVVAGTAAAPTAFGEVKGEDSLVYTSVRYYPFQK